MSYQEVCSWDQVAEESSWSLFPPSQACHLCETPNFQIGKAELMKDMTLEDWVGPHWSALVPSSWGGGCDYLDAKAGQREPIWLVNYP